MVCLSFLVSALLPGPLLFSPSALQMYTLSTDVHSEVADIHHLDSAEFAQCGCISFQSNCSNFHWSRCGTNHFLGDFSFENSMRLEDLLCPFKHPADIIIMRVFYVWPKTCSRIYVSAVEENGK